MSLNLDSTSAPGASAITKENADPRPTQIISTQTGAPVSKSGQRFGESFQNSVTAAYSNLTHSPLILALYVLAVFVMITTALDVPGPLEYIRAEINATATTTQWKAQKVICNIVIHPVNFLTVNKILFINTALLWVPYFKKPSSKNLKFSLLFSVILLVFTSLGFVEVFLLTQCWYLYTELRDPKYKMAIVLIPTVILLCSYMDSTPASIGKLVEMEDDLKDAIVDDSIIHEQNILKDKAAAREQSIKTFREQRKKDLNLAVNPVTPGTTSKPSP